ncbi:indoleamine 2,3-dioxygenase family protein [Verticillium alfalfae VaMs.102]|uniref:Indoleamine 2,3-dioxygenase family protein n=1 Tax=Verticillium alfalfae (strain VaMs.102 / ATCC MYA-4576 / FGSC 10136) TaxID=526221 RepID=C9S588_VERA1|nr:indoleamine 2,3-dioxygenase family protein [Verticillium alfalfae VaMs.102]EEY14188.1 indoleamine 2,3-dioxygenase family protein [Verticillium alfalfae VaMs.102]
MGSLGASASFPVLDDTRPHDKSLPAFMVSTTRGFLPRADPVVALPSEFDPVESLLSRMPIKLLDGSPGLLANNKFGDAVKDELPDLTEHIERYKDDLPVMNALYRDYSFLLSAYLLEPCHERFVKGEPYGLGRDVLPKQIARPMARCAELTGFKPFMEYAGSYALFNYRLEDPKQGMDYDNLRLIRAFEHGLDPTSSEAGFVLVHIEMVKNSGPLVKGAVSLLAHAANTSPNAALSLHQREDINQSLANVLASLRKINAAMETMWAKSKPMSYTSFRTFIFGITSQSMFPQGVTYEGVSDEPLSFRGESGANDSIVPLMDNLLQVTMPDTPLTAILRDFREYRPSNHRAFLGYVAERAAELDVKRLVLGLSPDGAVAAQPLPAAADEREALLESRRLWIKILHQVRDFRWRHWCFAREYILKRTSHPTATGGSPIVTWLPNQLQAVLAEMSRLYADVGGAEGDAALGDELADVMDLVERQKDTLQKEVDKYCAERGVNKADL